MGVHLGSWSDACEQSCEHVCPALGRTLRVWVFTPRGFLSAVQDRDDASTILVRARVREDLEATGWPIEATPDADYGYRTRVSRADWTTFLVTAASEVSYDNFKAAVAETDYERAALYTRVWAIMRELQQ